MPEYCRITGATLWSHNDFYVFYNFKQGDPDRMESDGVQHVIAESKSEAKQFFLQEKTENPELFEINKVLSDKEYWAYMEKK